MAKILLVEDDNLLHKLYEGALTDEGFDVVVASDGKTGLDLLKSKSFDLILLDIMLPGGVNGFDVLEVLKKDEALKKIPVIVLTNLESEEKVAREIGAVDYFKKTKVLPDQIVNRIKEILKIEN
jgi:DNA-binding response OmpR family regulator